MLHAPECIEFEIRDLELIVPAILEVEVVVVNVVVNLLSSGPGGTPTRGGHDRRNSSPSQHICMSCRYWLSSRTARPTLAPAAIDTGVDLEPSLNPAWPAKASVRHPPKPTVQTSMLRVLLLG